MNDSMDHIFDFAQQQMDNYSSHFGLISDFEITPSGYCSASMGSRCTGRCVAECKQSCKRSCYKKCTGTCSRTCGGECVNSCGGSCSGNCRGSCAGTNECLNGGYRYY